MGGLCGDGDVDVLVSETRVSREEKRRMYGAPRFARSTTPDTLKQQIVEPLSPALRHTSLFPPLPHPLVHGSGRHVKTLEGQQVSSSIGSFVCLLVFPPLFICVCICICIK